MLVQACGSEAQTAALIDNCVNELARTALAPHPYISISISISAWS